MEKATAVPSVGRLRREGPVKDVPGEGKTTRAMGSQYGDERSAKHYADAMSKRAGSARDP